MNRTISRAFFAVCAASSVYFIITLMPLSHSHVDGMIMFSFSIFLILLPFIVTQQMLDDMNPSFMKEDTNHEPRK